jgi:DNA-binding MarR family transcriptional regulator
VSSSPPSTAASATGGPVVETGTGTGTETAGPNPAPPALPTATVEAVRALARAARLLERASGEVNLAHYRVLAAIASGDQRASRIATKLALGKPTVSASVEWLSKRGLLARAGVQGDQRAASLQLTPEGTRWLNGVERAMAIWLEEICARTSPPGQTIRALASMGEAIEEIAAERFAEGG